ncbi:hypothetical protein FVE85_9225 [Porphyridium purpureum]|uniref:Uncharacterized protein n=1 Tax=Porphyridium purpureum TaxID=35688 RepID=A0A5J4YQA8_PORPP|nr:hypothetical protein FVE85_9225 [Porphyridium purpureum]|eukprot:POR9363..scf222_8
MPAMPMQQFRLFRLCLIQLEKPQLVAKILDCSSVMSATTRMADPPPPPEWLVRRLRSAQCSARARAGAQAEPQESAGCDKEPNANSIGGEQTCVSSVDDEDALAAQANEWNLARRAAAAAAAALRPDVQHVDDVQSVVSTYAYDPKEKLVRRAQHHGTLRRRDEGARSRRENVSREFRTGSSQELGMMVSEFRDAWFEHDAQSKTGNGGSHGYHRVRPSVQRSALEAIEDDSSWLEPHAPQYSRGATFPELRTLTLFYPRHARHLHLDPPDPPMTPPDVTDQVRAEFEQMKEHLFRRNSRMRREVDYVSDAEWARADRFLHAQAFLCAYFMGELKYARKDDLKPPLGIMEKEEAQAERTRKKQKSAADEDSDASSSSSSDADSFDAEEMDGMLRSMMELLSSGRVRVQINQNGEGSRDS